MMSEPAPGTFHTIPAATLVIYRHAADGGAPELLMVQRAKEMRFAGGMAVFPGGRIDPADRELAAIVATDLADDPDPEQGAARIAAVRETLEETGLLLGIAQPVTADDARAARILLAQEGALAPVLAHFGWTLALDRIEPFARWCPRREGAFDTRFFLADLGSGQVELAVDATENTRLFWASAANALAMADSGEIGVIFPTRRNLERLAHCGSFADTVAHAREFPVRLVYSFLAEIDGDQHLCIPEGHGYPVTHESMKTVRRGL
ncbi:MAG: NUDIX domain-containing protein [Sphingomonadales bacterium]|nr:NUDIX domain-containing protein [Sphingomonadales bacterium]